MVKLNFVVIGPYPLSFAQYIQNNSFLPPDLDINKFYTKYVTQIMVLTELGNIHFTVMSFYDKASNASSILKKY